MVRTTLPTGVKTLMGWREKGLLTFDNPVQRAGSQWNLLQKSLLIHSMLANYPIPAVYLLKNKRENDGVTEYDCLDSKQRLTSVFEFIGGEYALHSATPSVEIDGFIFDLANMKYEDLADECKDLITGYRFSINCIEDATEEEVEEIFKRLNNSTPLSAVQKARTVMGTDLARWTKEMCNHPFYQYSVSLTLAQARREADLETLLQSMLLLDSRHEGYEWKGISTAEVTKYTKHIRGKYNADKRKMIEEVLDYLFGAFPDKCSFLKKSNIPMVFVLAKVAMENNVSLTDFGEFIDIFAENISEEYQEGMGSGNIKRIKTEMRLRGIASEFGKLMGIADTRILSTLPANAENTTEEVESENEELLEESTSSDEVTEEVEEKSVDDNEDSTENTEDEVGAEDVREENTELAS